MRTVRHWSAIAVGAIISVATFGAAGVAQADGMARPGQAAAYVRPFTWTGFYIGGHVGYGWGDDNRVRDLDGYNASGFRIGDSDGASVGLQLGYNLQFQRFVAGIESDFGFLGVTGAAQFPPFIGVRTPADSAATVDLDYYGTITGRLGFTAGERLLIYGKAGWGWVHARASFTDSDPTGTILVSGLERKDTLSGGVWGGGVEYSLSDWFSLKVEYLHFDISDTLTHTARTSAGTPFRFAHDVADIDTVKVGFNIKFNRDPAPAKPAK